MRGSCRQIQVLVASVATLAACQAITDFTLTPVAETTEELCSDDRDNDFDGLTDCQDWNCLDTLSCCDIPELILEDDFDGGPDDCEETACAEATCAETSCGPDEERWHTWACPFPTVCNGAMRIAKTECFAAGALARPTLSLEPGLRIDVGIVGRPELRGYLEIALTLQADADLPGSFDQCGSFQRVSGFVTVTQEAVPDGYQLIAKLREVELGRSATITDTETPRMVTITIDRERRLQFAVDGDPFAGAPEPLPQTDEVARLALSGLTERAAFASARIQAGIRCHDPTSWVLAGADREASVVLDGNAAGTGFDSDEVFLPRVRVVGGDVELYYTGCPWGAQQGCSSLQIALGRAVSSGGGPFVRDPDNPLVVLGDIPSGALSGVNAFFTSDIFQGEPLRGYVASGWNDPIYYVEGNLKPGRSVLVGTFGDWNAEVCCPAAIEEPDGVVRLWYAGRPRLGEGVWRIGLATSEDGGETFENHPENPIFPEGPPGSFDSLGVLRPTVVFDESRQLYRMWYEAHDFFGKSSIGYAVSVDGEIWSRSPGGPVVVAADLDLASVGGPEVRLHPDGRLEMWIHGASVDHPRRRIFHLRNAGTRPGGEVDEEDGEAL
jgi:hypothetical protein